MASTKNKLSYQAATERLEQIIQAAEEGNIDIDQLGAQLREAQQLIALCRKKLYTSEEEVKAILQENE